MSKASYPSALVAFLLALLASPYALSASEHAIDTARSKITIHVGKAGLFSAAGHEHEVSAPIAEGAIDDSDPGRVWFRVTASTMTVLPEADQAAVQGTMQAKVLESDKYPEIKFESTSIRKVGDGVWLVTGKLTLHGATNSITTEVHYTNAAYIGEARIKQTQFGIEPYRAAGGAVKVKDELKIDFVVIAK